MKNIISYLMLLISVFIFISCDKDKEKDAEMQIGNLVISKEKPRPGDEISIRYSTDSLSKAPEASVMILVKNNFYGNDLELKDSSGVWTGNIKIPDSATAVVFNFFNDGKFDNNEEKGYAVPLYDENEEVLPGAKLGIGKYYISYGTWYYETGFDQDSALAMIESDIKKYPEFQEEIDREYANALMRQDAEKGKKYVQERITFYRKKDSLTADQYEILTALYGFNDEKGKSDSIRNVIIEKFPKHSIAQMQELNNFRKTQTLEEKEQMLLDYENNIGTDNNIYNYLARMVALEYAKQGDYEKVVELGEKMTKSEAASLYNSVAWPLAEQGKDLTEAEKISQKSVEYAEDLLEDNPDRDSFLTPKQYSLNAEYSLNQYRDTHAFINYKMGNIERALEIQEKAIGKRKDAEMNERYLQYLAANEKYKKLQEEAEAFMRENTVSEKAKDFLKEAFVKNSGSAEGFESYLAALEEEAHANLVNEIKKQMIDEPAPAFTMKNLDGTEVSLTSLKGKTIILDFWATWCGPCKASFPGMKMAVEQYEENPAVKFLFVDTFENTPTREQDVADFIKENNYPFHVLFDPMKEGEKGYVTADDYGISGIPTKVIISPEGTIKFKIIGYGGNNTKMIQELGIMIDLLANKPSNGVASQF